MAPLKARTKRRHSDNENVIGEDEEARLARTLFGTDHCYSNKVKLGYDEPDANVMKINLPLIWFAASTKLKFEGAQACVWHDNDDDCTDGSVQFSEKNSIAPPKRNACFIHSRKEKYQNRLRKMFMRYYGTPDWARKEKAKEVDVSEELEEAVSKLTGSARKSLDKDPLLAKGIISVTYCPDITIGHHDNRPINILLFHKIKPVVLTGGDSGKVQLFRVGARLANGNFLQNVQFSDFPITSMGFVQDGNAVICGSGRQRYMMKYHLEQGSVMQLNLPKCISNQCYAHFDVSDDGSLLAMIAQGSQVFIFSLPTMELVKSLSAPSEVSSLQFFPDSNREIWALTEKGEVIIWNLMGFQHVFYDEGAVHGTKIRLSSDGRKVACGWNTGIVDVYDVTDVRNNKHPKPLTTVSNLTTSCDSISFSYDSQIMAFSSRAKKNQVKLLHVASGTVFSNYPGRHEKVNNVECIEFSPHSAYLGLGCSNGQFLLERLNYYKEY